MGPRLQQWKFSTAWTIPVLKWYKMKAFLCFLKEIITTMINIVITLATIAVLVLIPLLFGTTPSLPVKTSKYCQTQKPLSLNLSLITLQKSIVNIWSGYCLSVFEKDLETLNIRQVHSHWMEILSMQIPIQAEWCLSKIVRHVAVMPLDPCQIVATRNSCS